MPWSPFACVWQHSRTIRQVPLPGPDVLPNDFLCTLPGKGTALLPPAPPSARAASDVKIFHSETRRGTSLLWLCFFSYGLEHLPVDLLAIGFLSLWAVSVFSGHSVGTWCLSVLCQFRKFSPCGVYCTWQLSLASLLFDVTFTQNIFISTNFI